MENLEGSMRTREEGNRIYASLVTKQLRKFEGKI